MKIQPLLLTRTTWLLVFVLYSSLHTFGQGFERPRSVPGQQEGSEKAIESELFQQVSLNLSNVVPRVNLKAIKLYAKFGEKKYLDFYVLSSLPSIAVDPLDSVKNLSDELQNLYGGLLNGYLSKTWYFNKSSDFETRGLQVDLRGGYKLATTAKEKGSENVFLGSGFLTGEARFLIPLVDDISSDKLGGLLQLKLSGQALYSNSADYLSYFKLPDGADPSEVYAVFNYEVSLHIVNQFYLSVGGSVSSVKSMEDLGYFKISYSKE